MNMRTIFAMFAVGVIVQPWSALIRPMLIEQG